MIAAYRMQMVKLLSCLSSTTVLTRLAHSCPAVCISGVENVLQNKQAWIFMYSVLVLRILCGT